MRSATALSGRIKFTYPDAYSFCFNPNYLEIECGEVSSVLVDVSVNNSLNKTIIVNLYDRKARVYLSRLFELMFTEPETTRSLPILVKIGAIDGSSTYFSFYTTVIWGSLPFGEKFGTFGAYDEDRLIEKKLIWFRKFPFQLTVFKYSENVSGIALLSSDNSQIEFDLTLDSYDLSFIDKFYEPFIYDSVCDTPSALIYFSSINKLVAQSGLLYYSKWKANNGFASSEDLVGKNNEPLKTIEYILTDENNLKWIYRYNGHTLFKAGLKHSSGFYSFLPEDIFGNPSHDSDLGFDMSGNYARISVFDETFDYTFRTLADSGTGNENMIICDDTCGHYLRWVDTQGYLQYFLFRKGTRTYKTTLGNDKVIDDVPYNGMYFPNLGRTINIDVTETYKCCATGLPPEIYCWVRSVITSPIVDLFLGWDSKDNEIWIPVKIQATSYNYKYKEKIHDLELTFKVPGYVAQSL